MLRSFSLAFLCGFLSTLLFHQGGVFVLYLFKVIPFQPWDFSLNPQGVPKVISLAFFGGLWAMASLLLAQKIQKNFWALQIIFGAIGPTAVAMLVVFPLKGLVVSAPVVVGGLLLNGLWGLGVAMGLKLFKLPSTR
jgi:hypothetical protein